jgi:homoserine kinase
VLFIPDEEMSTTEARKALPEQLSYEDAIHNISRASMLVNCFATGQFDPLRYAMQDRLHQPYRSHMFPYEPIIKVALEAGAHGAYLSGAGPTVLAITGGIGRANVGDDTMSHFLAEATADAMIRARPRTAPHRTAPHRTAPHRSTRRAPTLHPSSIPASSVAASSLAGSI